MLGHINSKKTQTKLRNIDFFLNEVNFIVLAKRIFRGPLFRRLVEQVKLLRIAHTG